MPTKQELTLDEVIERCALGCEMGADLVAREARPEAAGPPDPVATVLDPPWIAGDGHVPVGK